MSSTPPKPEISIAQAIQMRLMLEESIRRLVSEYQTRTGLQVRGISIETVATHAVGQAPFTVPGEVSVDVRL